MNNATIADTSLKAFQENQKKFDRLKDKIQIDLERFYIEHRFWPTYNELQKYMIRKREDITWRTQIQPRLTNELVKKGKVETNGKRECHISGEEIQTWKVKN